ncbi:MAG TPA: heavy metal translocating P-type ATPase [Candidatus Acidoferrales bacterium]|nr:heavy metal translocating P-type ATPase [Candidatus Acidoferrales bacterium]
MTETTVTFKILGMTCTMCALTIEKQLSNLEGVTHATVNFALAWATVTYKPDKIASKQLAQAIRDSGYDVDIERTEFDITGIICVACTTAIENTLKEVPGVIDASINPVTAKAVIDYDPSIATINTIIQTIQNTGYDVSEVPPVEAKAARVDRERTLREQEIIGYRNQLGKTVMLLAVNNVLEGAIALADTVREEASGVITELRDMEIKTAMITGDNQMTANATARQVKIDKVFSEVLPQDKSRSEAITRRRPHSGHGGRWNERRPSVNSS